MLSRANFYGIFTQYLRVFYIPGKLLEIYFLCQRNNLRVCHMNLPNDVLVLLWVFSVFLFMAILIEIVAEGYSWLLAMRKLIHRLLHKHSD